MSDNDLNQSQNQQNAGSDQETGDNSVQAAGATQDKEAQRKGGQHSHSGSSKSASSHSSSDEDEDAGSSRSGSSASGSESGSNRNASGQSDDESGSDRSRSNQPRGAAVDKEAQRKGGQHSHGGQGNH
jgi:hypothetical protein